MAPIIRLVTDWDNGGRLGFHIKSGRWPITPRWWKDKEKQIAFTLADYQRRRRTEMFHIWFNSLSGNHKVSTSFFVWCWHANHFYVDKRSYTKECGCSYGEQTATDMSRWIMTVQPLHSFVILQWYGGRVLKRVPMTFDPISFILSSAFSFAKKNINDVVLMSTYI